MYSFSAFKTKNVLLCITKIDFRNKKSYDIEVPTSKLFD